MKIQTQRLTIRPFAQDDRNAMCSLLTDEQVRATYMIPEFASQEEVLRFADRFTALSKREDRVAAGIELEGKLIGFLNDVWIEDERVELGYVIDPAYHNHGYMTEALRAVMGALFAQGYREIVAGAFEENCASIRVMEKCGMKKQAKTETIQYRAKEHACVYYAMTKENWNGEASACKAHAEKARALFKAGCSCSQAVVGAYAQEIGLDDETAMRLASSFGGGMGGARELCGAVTGMLMVAGLKWGHSDGNDHAAKTAHYARTRALIGAFKEEHGTMVCRELLASLKELRQEPSVRTEEYYKIRPCVRFVETAAALIERMDEKVKKGD